jgi:hypothetical protein
MKKSEKNNLILFLILFPIISWGQNFGFVNSVKGKAFLVDEYGNTKLLKRGDGLELNSQVFVEEKGQLTFADYNDRQYDLAPEGHLKFGKNQIEISKGFLRIKSRFVTNKVMNVKTANSSTSFSSGEAILSYDPSNASTQLLSIDGHFNFENPLLVGSKIEVYGGQFSTIQADLTGGQPQSPAKIGEKSLNLAVSEFYTHKTPSRSISSVKKAAPTPGKIIFIPKKMAKKKAKPSKLKRKIASESDLTPVSIHIFGQKRAKRVKGRDIASEKNETDSLMNELKAVK